RAVRTIPELIRAAVDDAGDQPWLRTHDAELTYAQMLARVERAASALRALGVGRGDRVLTTPRNTADYLLSWFALMETGAIQVPINPKSSEAEVAGFVQQVEPALVVTDPGLAPLVGSSARVVDVASLYDAAPDGRGPASLDETDVAVMIPTSGTTG